MDTHQVKKPVIKSYDTLMGELRHEARRNKAAEGIGTAVIIAVGFLLALVALIGAMVGC